MQKNYSFKKLCEKLGINYKTAHSYKTRHPELTKEQVIEYYKNKSESFASKCKKAGINYSAAISYKQRHPELTDDEVIIYYRPDCYINIFGNLVIPEED